MEKRKQAKRDFISEQSAIRLKLRMANIREETYCGCETPTLAMIKRRLKYSLLAAGYARCLADSIWLQMLQAENRK